MKTEKTENVSFSLAEYTRQAREAEESKLIEIELPSGVSFYVKQPDIYSLVMSDDFPAEIKKRIKTGNYNFNHQNSLDLLDFTKVLLKKICVVPQIVSEPQTDQEISFDLIRDEDIEALSRAAFEVLEDAAKKAQDKKAKKTKK